VVPPDSSGPATSIDVPATPTPDKAPEVTIERPVGDLDLRVRANPDSERPGQYELYFYSDVALDDVYAFSSSGTRACAPNEFRGEPWFTFHLDTRVKLALEPKTEIQMFGTDRDKRIHAALFRVKQLEPAPVFYRVGQVVVTSREEIPIKLHPAGEVEWGVPFPNRLQEQPADGVRYDPKLVLEDFNGHLGRHTGDYSQQVLWDMVESGEKVGVLKSVELKPGDVLRWNSDARIQNANGETLCQRGDQRLLALVEKIDSDKIEILVQRDGRKLSREILQLATGSGDIYVYRP
jgi:hypothetical protein